MKIAIAASGKTLTSEVDPRFGRCPYFLLVDNETDEFEVMENTAGQAFHGAGVSAAQMVVDKGVRAVIAGNFGPNAVNVLTGSGVKIFGGLAGLKAEEALEKYKEGKLDETMATSSPGMGRGRGRGRGQCQGGGWRQGE